jgi:hypothetical protein
MEIKRVHAGEEGELFHINLEINTIRILSD